MAAPKMETELLNPPSDGVSALNFCPGSPELLVASSWDTGVRVYDVAANKLLAHFVNRAAVLDCCWAGGSARVASAGLDHGVKLYDVATSSETLLGSHAEAARRVVYTPENVLVSGGWDSELKWWDPRDNHCAGTSKLPAKVFSMSCCAGRVVAATSDRRVIVYDVRKTSEPEQNRESSLKFQTRVIACYPDSTGFAIGSIEGRIAMEYFDMAPEVQAQKYAFKCHRIQSPEGCDIVHPVNAIAFHPGYGTFASGGCDGHVFTWDGRNKKRLCQTRQYPSSIASLAFNDSGALLAVASSYTWEEGEKPNAPRDQIFVRPVADLEIKPKPKAQQ
eukprot:m51a1_g12231 putative mitotic checkpoint protein BUB3 (333) ;mRNA; r:78625-79997